MHEELLKLLRELREALSKVLVSTPEVGEAVRQIEESGFSLYVLIDRRDYDKDDPATEPPKLDGKRPVFRIDGQDLVFLRSIGIDPTRRTRSRRRRNK